MSAGPNPELERAFRIGGAGAVPSQDAPVREANTGGRFATLGSSQPGKNNIKQASFRVSGFLFLFPRRSCLGP
jgi:hypothetical protein